MIVRILGDGQYRIPNDQYGPINAIDDELEAAASAGDADGFAAALHKLVGAIREVGAPVPDDEFIGSDAVVPDADTSLEEARELILEQGLIPD